MDTRLGGDMIQLLSEYGLAIVFINVFVEQMGAPIPALPLLVVAGALVRDGGLSPGGLFLAAFAAATISDLLWFGAGRLYGRRVIGLLCRISLSPDTCPRQTEDRYRRWGALSLLLNKFIPGLSTIVRPLAGALNVPWSRFLLLNSLGTMVWIMSLLGLGLVLHRQIDQVLAYLGRLGSVAGAAVAVALIAYIAYRWYDRRRLIRMMRVTRINADELFGLMNTQPPPVIVDLRSSVILETDRRRIPGAIALDLSSVDRQLNRLPVDREIVFYCSCPNEASAALAARKLLSLGYTRVRPLLGGMDGWIGSGYEVDGARLDDDKPLLDAMTAQR